MARRKVITNRDELRAVQIQRGTVGFFQLVAHLLEKDLKKKKGQT